MKREIKAILFFGVAGICMMAIIGFAGIKNSEKQVNDVIVKILDQNGDFFTDQLEVLNLLNAQNTDYVLGLSIKDLNLKVLESRVEKHPFIKDAQIFREVKGNLVVKVEQAQPVARIFSRSGKDQYIDKTGRLIPTSSRHTARVPLIELERKFSWEQNISETKYGEDLLALLNYIDEDEFWKAQIAQLVIQKDGELTMLPQITKQEIAFGMPEDYEGKFKKLKLFYKEVLPNKGWNTYSLVNLKFKNQIVCE